MIGRLTEVLPLLNCDLFPAFGVKAGTTRLVLPDKVLTFGCALLIITIKNVIICHVTRAAFHRNYWEVAGEVLGDFELPIYITNVVDSQWIPSHMTSGLELLRVVLRLLLIIRRRGGRRATRGEEGFLEACLEVFFSLPEEVGSFASFSFLA